MWSLLPILLFASSTQSDESLRTVRYDVRTILASGLQDSPALEPPNPLPAIDSIYAELDDDRGPFGEYSNGSPDRYGLIALLETTVAAVSGARLESADGFRGVLEVEANGIAHGEIAVVLEALTREAEHRFLVEVLRVDAGTVANERFGVLTPERATAVAEGATDRPRYLGWARLGRTVRIGAETTAQYVQDVDIEVTPQGGTMADPTINRMHTGLSLRVRIDRDAFDQRLVVRLWGRFSSLGRPMRVRNIEAWGKVAVEHPELATEAIRVSGSVAPGGGFLVQAGHPDDHALLVRILGEVETRQDTNPIVDFGPVLLRPFRDEPTLVGAVSPSRGLDLDSGEVATITLPWLDDNQGPFIVEDVIQRYASDGEALTGVRVGASAVVPCAPGVRRALRSAIRKSVTGGSTIEIDVARLQPEAADLARLLADPEALVAACEGSATRARGCVYGSDTLELLGGTLTNHAPDHDVDVGNTTVGGDPRVHQVFSGSRFWCSPVSVREGEVVVWFSWLYQRGFDEPRLVELNTLERFGDSELKGSVRGVCSPEIERRRSLKGELATSRIASGRALVTFTDGVWQVVGAQPLAGESTTQLVAARVRVAPR